MLNIPKSSRAFIVGLLVVAILPGCLGDSAEEPTQTPVIVTATPSAPTAEATPEPSPTTASQATVQLVPTATPTLAPTATPQPSPTPRPTAFVAPTSTSPEVVSPTATPPVFDGVEFPEDPLAIIPALADLPAGMAIVDEGEADIDLVASDFDDADARVQQLRDWGFRGAAFREVELPQDAIVDQASQPLGMIFQFVLLDTPENAQLEMNSFFDEVVLADPDLSFEEVAVQPLGDGSRGGVTTTETPDLGEVNFAVLVFTAGPFAMHYAAVSGVQYDPYPDLVAAATATLGYLGYAAFPEIGEVLLRTDFSDWPTGAYESGSLAIDADGYYHVLVSEGDGSFISAYSTDHEPFTDIAVSVDMRMLGGDPTSQGCVMTRVDQLDQQYDYALCVDGNGNVEALYEQFDGDGNYSSEPLLPAGTVTVDPPFDWTTLTIITRGEELWFLINGELIDTVRHTGPPGGSVGVIVNHFAEAPQLPAEFIFTNLVVQAVE